MSDANSRQPGGTHYIRLGATGEQHWDRMWRLVGRGWFVGNITKYAERYHLKNGMQDLEKVLHYAQKLKELEQAWMDGTGPPPGEAGAAPLPGADYHVPPPAPPGDPEPELTPGNVFDMQAKARGLGHWKCVDPRGRNELWERSDGVTCAPFADGWTGTWAERLQEIDRRLGLPGAGALACNHHNAAPGKTCIRCGRAAPVAEAAPQPAPGDYSFCQHNFPVPDQDGFCGRCGKFVLLPKPEETK